MSHLDLMRLMQRAFRRAGVVLHHSQGFTPHAYVSMLLPLSVGMESVCELMEYELDGELAVTPEALNAVLPEGVRVLEVYESTRKARELRRLRALLTLEYDGAVPEPAAITALLERPELVVEKRTKRGMWLMANYDGKKISDLSNVMPIDSGYGTAFSYAAAESVDIIVCYADGRNDYEASWTLPVDQKDETGKQGMGRSDSIWNELNVIGVTDGIYNDTVAISKESPYYTPEMIDALQQCFINIINTDEGQAIFSVYSHTGYAIAKDSDYDGARAALAVVS